MSPLEGRGPTMRVEWTPGSDDLTGRCHCGAWARRQDPVAVWAWLLDHPDHESPTWAGGTEYLTAAAR
jgi:hypothetical protein